MGIECSEEPFLALSLMVVLLPRECSGIEFPWDPFPAPAKTGIADPITLAPFHSLSPPSQTETNA